MNKRPLSAYIILFLGLLTMLTPYAIFPVCSGALLTTTGMAVPMKCFWTARAALGVGGAIAFGGLIALLVASPGLRAGIAIMLLPLSSLSVLFPSVLIGVCASETMPCRMATLPALCLLGGLTGLAAAALLWKSLRQLRSAAGDKRAGK